jgi:hypothetical protein
LAELVLRFDRVALTLFLGGDARVYRYRHDRHSIVKITFWAVSQ